MGWVNKEYGERRQKLQSARPAPLFCFRVPSLYIPYYYSALLSFGPKNRTFKFLFVGLFFEAKSMIITTSVYFLTHVISQYLSICERPRGHLKSRGGVDKPRSFSSETEQVKTVDGTVLGVLVILLLPLLLIYE